MEGYHDVKMFMVTFEALSEGWSAPVGWKPFAAIDMGNVMGIICRNWQRAPK